MKPLSQPGGFAIAAFFTLAPAVSVGGALALPVLLCLAGAASIRPSLLRRGLQKKPLFAGLVLALTAWSMLSTAWSPLPLDDQVYKLAAIVPLGLIFVASASADVEMRRLTAAGGLAATLVLLPLLGIEALWDMPLNRAANPNEQLDQLWRLGGHGTTVLLAMAWSAAAVLIGLGGIVRKLVAIALLAACAWLSTQFGQLANAAAFMAGIVAFAGALAAPRATVWLVSCGLAAWIIAAPFVSPLLFANEQLVNELPFSAAHRAGIWDYISARVIEQPWFGHGLEASRAVTDHIEVQGRIATATPIHPHSASLQLWYETGAVGAVLAAAALVAGGAWLSRELASDRPAAAAAAATLASMGLVANVSYGIWAEWWMSTMFIGAAVVGATRTVEMRRG